MGLSFRRREYRLERQAHSLPRTPVEIHPLSVSSPSALQVKESNSGMDNFFDPLRATDGKMEVFHPEATVSSIVSSQVKIKEPDSLKKILMQRFPVSKTILISMANGLFMECNKELDDHQKIVKDVPGISQQEYVSQLHGLKDEIKKAWGSDDKVTSLRLSIKVARLLMDTSVIQFYPTLFVLVTDIMNMLGDLVWNRIKQKAEFTEDGQFILSLPDDFQAADVYIDAKETCNNWFFKISSVCELLPRM